MKLLLGLLMLCSPVLWAHSGFMEYSGLIHPITGWDHIVFAYAAGILLAKQNRWLPYASFLVPIAVGAVLGHNAGVIAAADHIMLWSVVLLGIGLIGCKSLPLVARGLIIGLFAFAHGFVHGVEIGSGMVVLGILFSSSIIFYAGRLTAQLIQQPLLYTLLGGAMAIAGLLAI